jgi:hypothetical protein
MLYPDEQLTIPGMARLVLCAKIATQRDGMLAIVGPILMSLDCPIKRLKRLSDCVEKYPCAWGESTGEAGMG